MSLEIFWTLPTAGDVRIPARRREPSLAYLADVARAIEFAGFDGAFLPSSRHHLDPFLVAAALAPRTESLSFLLSFRAGLALPAVVAQQVQTLQHLSNHRIQLHLNTRETPTERARYGDHTESALLADKLQEFIVNLQSIWNGRPYHFEGKHYRIQGGGLLKPLARKPTLHMELRDDTQLDLAARYADRVLLEAKAPENLRATMLRLHESAAAYRREVKTALRLSLVTRDTENEAKFEAERWADSSRSLRGKGAPIVGHHQAVLEELLWWRDLGVDTFILSSPPHWEEALRFGEEILPELRKSPPPRTQQIVSRSLQSPGVNI